jgi:protein-L-isoaspartate(D-aspartate) O-methyltransferase
VTGADDPAHHDGYADARREMVRSQLRPRGIRDPATLTSIGLVPREEFVPAIDRRHAYADRALDIGRGQTISQPYMVARMTQALDVAEQGWPWGDARPTFLDVGTGSGYQAAVLSQLGARVVSVERDPELAAVAQKRLERLGYDVDVVVADGSLGLPDLAPFAGIIVAAGAPSVPGPLVAQLAQGARLVIPVGARTAQRITIIHRRATDTITHRIDACVFVPLVGRHGHPS